jgi:hypothetical protein
MALYDLAVTADGKFIFTPQDGVAPVPVPTPAPPPVPVPPAPAPAPVPAGVTILNASNRDGACSHPQMAQLTLRPNEGETVFDRVASRDITADHAVAWPFMVTPLQSGVGKGPTFGFTEASGGARVRMMISLSRTAGDFTNAALSRTNVGGGTSFYTSANNPDGSQLDLTPGQWYANAKLMPGEKGQVLIECRYDA